MELSHIYLAVLSNVKIKMENSQRTCVYKEAAFWRLQRLEAMYSVFLFHAALTIVRLTIERLA